MLRSMRSYLGGGCTAHLSLLIAALTFLLMTQRHLLAAETPAAHSQAGQDPIQQASYGIELAHCLQHNLPKSLIAKLNKDLHVEVVAAWFYPNKRVRETLNCFTTFLNLGDNVKYAEQIRAIQDVAILPQRMEDFLSRTSVVLVIKKPSVNTWEAYSDLTHRLLRLDIASLCEEEAVSFYNSEDSQQAILFPIWQDRPQPALLSPSGISDRSVNAMASFFTTADRAAVARAHRDMGRCFKNPRMIRACMSRLEADLPMADRYRALCLAHEEEARRWIVDHRDQRDFYEQLLKILPYWRILHLNLEGTNLSYFQVTRIVSAYSRLERVTYSDGVTYSGSFRAGRPHGFGIQAGPGGFRYEGQWSDGRLDGRGTQSFPDGRRYEGQFCKDKRQGQGTVYYTNGRSEAGQWHDDQMVEPEDPRLDTTWEVISWEELPSAYRQIVLNCPDRLDPNCKGINMGFYRYEPESDTCYRLRGHREGRSGSSKCAVM